MSVKKLITSVTFMVLFPIGLAAQIAPSSPMGGGPVATFGSSASTPLMFQGQATPTNLITISTGFSTLYDDNILARNTDRYSDEALSIDSQIGISRKTEHVTINLDYTPFYVLYRQYTALDRVNHAATLTMKYRLSSRFFLGLHDYFSYMNGLYPTIAGQTLVAGPASPTALNAYLFPPTVRTLLNTPGLDLTFVKSSRTSLTLSGNYSQQKFASPAGSSQPLYNGATVSGGLDYQYRVTKHTSFGLLLQHQDSTYQGGEVFGSRQRTQVESAYVSVGTQVSPTVTLSLFGGPQYINTFGQVSTGSSLPGVFDFSGGGSITKEVRKTALDLSLQRAASDGGGLYTSVISTNASFGVRRRLVGRWEASLSGGAAQAETTLLHIGKNQIESVTGGFTLYRPLRGGSTFHIAYTTTHQLSTGNLPISADFDRDQVNIGFDYQLKAIPVGR